ncbi:SURF1 family cytochrome oxidase biogenesis protein, partial [Enterococcus faecium]
MGQRVEASGHWIASDFLVVASRFNDDVEGYWVTGQLRLDGTATPTSIAVALGWTKDAAAAQNAVRELDAQVAA